MGLIQSQTMNYIFLAVIYILAFLIGLVVFSYLNEVIRRLPEHKKASGIRSTCPKCGQQLKLWDAMPVVSYIKNKGKCVYCKEKLPLRDLLVELLGGVLAVAVVWQYSLSVPALLMFLLYAVLTVIACVDADTQEIPPILNLMILLLGIVRLFAYGFSVHALIDCVIGFFCISLPLYIIVLIVPDGFGGGDIKMMAAAGFFLGWKATLFAFFVGLVLGGAYGIYLLAAKKSDKKAHFAFGPFLAIGIAVSAYAGLGTAMMNQYLEPFYNMMKYM